MILDTNALSALLDGDAALVELLRPQERLSLPAIVLGEYRFSLEQSTHRSQLGRLLDGLEKHSIVLTVDAETARHYARVRTQLKRNGTPIPENDVWIAALAAQHAAPVVSRDRHFDQVERLQRISW